MDRTAHDGLPPRCHQDGCTEAVTRQIVWISDPGCFRLTCDLHIAAALQAGETNWLLRYPFATPTIPPATTAPAP